MDSEWIEDPLSSHCFLLSFDFLGLAMYNGLGIRIGKLSLIVVNDAWNSFELDSAWVKNRGCCHIFFLSCILGPLAMCDSCVFGL